MKIKMLITADYASVDQATGKLNILGAFSRIQAASFPVIHKRMALAVQLSVSDLVETTDTREFEVILTDEDGTEYFQVSGPVSIPIRENGSRPNVNYILEINNLEFPHSGNYVFTVYIDSESIGHTEIELLLAEQQSE